MKKMLSYSLTVGFALFILTGCAVTPDKYAQYEKVNVVTTEDQKFIVGTEKLTASEFADKADYNRKSAEIIFSVDKDSKAQRSTIMELVTVFRNRGYAVHMATGSKYADITN